MSEPPEHGRDAIKKLERLLAARRIEIAPGVRDSEPGENFVGAARGDAPVVEAVATDALPAFRQIQRQRRGGSPNLIEELRIAATDDGERFSKRPDQLQADFKRMKQFG